MTLKEAKNYISLGIEFGHWGDDLFDYMTDEELTAFAEKKSEEGNLTL